MLAYRHDGVIGLWIADGLVEKLEQDWELFGESVSNSLKEGEEDRQLPLYGTHEAAWRPPRVYLKV